MVEPGSVKMLHMGCLEYLVQGRRGFYGSDGRKELAGGNFQFGGNFYFYPRCGLKSSRFVGNFWKATEICRTINNMEFDIGELSLYWKTSK